MVHVTVLTALSKRGQRKLRSSGGEIDLVDDMCAEWDCEIKGQALRETHCCHERGLWDHEALLYRTVGQRA